MARRWALWTLVAGILVVGPYYNRPSQAGMASHVCAVADVTSLPVMVYDIPIRTGRKIATDMARDLTTVGVVVVSGLARGIDSAAHQGALQALDQVSDCPGSTIAVIAGGIDVLYPPENGPLFERIGAEGLIIAELPPGTEKIPFATVTAAK